VITSLPPRTKTTWALAVSALLLVAGATYQATVALGFLAMGKGPGGEPAGSEIVALTVLLAFVIGIIASVSCAFRRDTEWKSVAPLIAPASAAFVVADFYTFDSYFLPTLRRFSEDGVVAGRWIVALVVIALVASALSKLRPRISIFVTSILLVLGAYTSMIEGMGH
jgi:hypothetical protein